MRAYFPLPPSIEIPNSESKIIGSITFLNSPNNRLKNVFLKADYKKVVFLGIYALRKKGWTLLNILKCNPYEFIEISRNELQVEDKEIIIIVVKKSNKFEFISSKLPEPDNLKIDNSEVNQRVSINFSYLGSTSSYQGEYPFNMSCLEKGSFFSFDTLKNKNNSNIRNYLILINVSRNLNESKNIKIKLFNPLKSNQFKYLIANTNAYTIFDTKEYENEFGDRATIFITSEVCSFIPLILSLDSKSNQISVEHNHPPTEYFFGPEKYKIVNFIKKQWVFKKTN